MARLVRGLWRHKNGFWYFSRMRDGVRKTVALETKDENEAIVKALEVVDAPELAISGTWLAEIEAFIAFKLNRNEFSRFSAENKKLTLKRFAKWIGENSSISKVGKKDIQKFYDEERKRVTRSGEQVKESTVQGYMMCLRSFFSWLHKERKAIAANPVEGISMARWDYGTKEDYCKPELRDALLCAWKKIPAEVMKRDQAREIAFVLHCGFEAGLRRNEIIEARPAWFNASSRSLRVSATETFRPKDREARSIPLTDVFLSFLKKYSMEGDFCIAPKKTRGKSRYRYDFIVPFRRYVDHVGSEIGESLDWLTPHIMRHTFGSLLAIAGESLAKISEWMGDDPRVTERHYLHFKEGDEAINALHSFSSPRKPQSSKRQSPLGKSASSKPAPRRNRKG